MLQIKTIRRVDPCEFDDAVNAALLEGWTLTRRHTGADFVAELEKEVITEREKCCENCKHCDLRDIEEPCFNCYDASHWTDPNA